MSTPKTIIEFNTRQLNANILVIDDMLVQRMMLADILQQAGFMNIHICKDGEEGLNYIEKHDIDLIILDLIMPGVDGFEFCKRMQEMPKAKRIPTLVQTALSNAEERLDIFKVGASDMLTKPVNPTELLLRIRLHLEYAFSFNDVNAYKTQIDEDLKFAKNTQLDLLPDEGETERLASEYGLQLSSYYQASAAIGGDLWNIRPIDERKLGFFSFDVAGHGVPAAINAFRAHSLINLTTLKHTFPSEYAQSLNQQLCDLFRPGQFITFICGIIDLKHGKITYASAGHPPPALFQQQTGKTTMLDSKGMPLGISKNTSYEDRITLFSAGDSFMLYSDALIETMCVESGGFLSEGAILRACSPLLNTPKDGIKAAHQDCIERLTQRIGVTKENPAVEDDLTIVFMTRMH